MFNGNLKTALSNLRQYKWRSLLTMMGVIIGISSVVTFVSLGEGLKRQVVGQINRLGSDVLTVRPGKLTASQKNFGFSGINTLVYLSSSTLTAADVKTVSGLSSVGRSAPLDFLTNSVSAGNQQLDNVFVMGTSPDLPGLLRQKVSYGNFLSDEAEAAGTVVVGSAIAQKLYGRPNPIGESMTIAGESFIVRGVLEQSAGGLQLVGGTDLNSSVFLPFEKARALADGQTSITQILVRSKDPDNLESTINDIRRALLVNHKSQDDFSIIKKDELLSLLSGVINSSTAFISGIAAISLLVGGIGIMSIMLVSISERTREIGIRKAIGATNRQVLNQFLVEGLVLTIVGGVLGVTCALLINLGLRLYTSLHPVLGLPIILLAVAVSVVVGVVFSAAPAFKAARKDPIVALRGE